jgi:hypothetical protein
MMGLFVAVPPLRATRFEASLPIAGRDLFLARALSIMAIVWLPAMAGAAAAAIFWGLSAVAVRALIVATLCTLAAGALQSLRVRELAAPKWTLVAFCALIPAAVMYVDHHRTSALIPAFCALAGIALLARTWSVVPKSFELAPAKPRAGDGPARPARPARAVSPRFVWLPVLRSVFTIPYTYFLFPLLVVLVGQWLTICFWIVFAWLIARNNTLWLRPLPIRPRVLLIAMVAPILLVLAGGYFAGFHFGRHPRPVPVLAIQALDLGALLGWALAVVLVTALGDWRRLTHISRKVRLIVFGVLMGVPFVGGIGGSVLLHGVDPLHLAALRLAAALPDNAGIAMALVLAVLGALWLAIEKVFAEGDYADKPRVQKDEYFA